MSQNLQHHVLEGDQWASPLPAAMVAEIGAVIRRHQVNGKPKIALFPDPALTDADLAGALRSLVEKLESKASVAS